MVGLSKVALVLLPNAVVDGKLTDRTQSCGGFGTRGGGRPFA